MKKARRGAGPLSNVVELPRQWATISQPTLTSGHTAPIRKQNAVLNMFDALESGSNGLSFRSCTR